MPCYDIDKTNYVDNVKYILHSPIDNGSEALTDEYWSKKDYKPILDRLIYIGTRHL